MIDGIIEWFKDWWKFPEEIRKINKKTEGVSKANVIAFFTLIASCAICLYFGYWIFGLSLIVPSFIALMWNGEIATVLMKVSMYVLGASAIGGAISGLAMLMFTINFWTVMVGISAAVFVGAIIFLGTD